MDQLIQRFRERIPVRATSLIITLFGDVVEPHGGTVWLGSLIKILAPFGISERLVRTSVFRLSKEGWINPQKNGRRSYYGISVEGRRRFERAFGRVYALNPLTWNGSWIVLIIPERLSREQGRSLGRELQWLGVGELAPGAYACPRECREEIVALLHDHGISAKSLLFVTQPVSQRTWEPMRAILFENWKFDELEALYSDFIDFFSTVSDEVLSGKWQTPESCFLIRLMLIHAYRKIILRDPLLPEELLPGDWPGLVARRLCKSLYKNVTTGTEIWLRQSLETPDGAGETIHADFYRRFGGLKSIGLPH